MNKSLQHKYLLRSLSVNGRINTKGALANLNTEKSIVGQSNK